MKPLEALERLCFHLDYKDNYIFNGEYDEDNEIIEKSLKALEIIKDKRVNVWLLLCCDTIIKYNTGLCSGIYLIQTEFDLLKEVLL